MELLLCPYVVVEDATHSSDLMIKFICYLNVIYLTLFNVINLLREFFEDKVVTECYLDSTSLMITSNVLRGSLDTLSYVLQTLLFSCVIS